MTEIAFHFNAPDKLAYACRLLRKAVSSGARVVVTGEPASLQALDTLLWTYREDSFLPHGTAKDGEPETQPIYLTVADDNPNSADVRFFIEGAVAAQREDAAGGALVEIELGAILRR